MKNQQNKIVNRPIDLRPSVRAFAEHMELVLQIHDAKKGGQANWRKDDPRDLIARVIEEADELSDAYDSDDEDEARSAASEAIDVANMAMMVFDTLHGLPSDPTGPRKAKVEPEPFKRRGAFPAR